MSRATVILNSRHERERVASWAQQASPGTIVEFRQSKRTLDQNARLWACLTEIARKVEWHGMKLPADDWKDIFTAALRKHRFVPGLDANTVVPLGMRTSDMTKQEFGDLLELINAFAAERGIEFQDYQSSDTPSPSDDNGSDGKSPSPESTVAAELSEPADEADEEAGDIEAQEEPDASSASESISDQQFLIRVYETMQDCVGPSVEDFNQAFKIFADELSSASDEVKRKAENIRASLEFCCGEKPMRTKLQARSYLAGIIGVDEKELV